MAHNGTRRRPYRGTWQKAFLAALAKEGTVSAACQRARVGRRTVYHAKEQDADFAAAWDEALAHGPQVRRRPVEHQTDGEVDDEEDEEKGQREEEVALARVHGR